MIDIDEVYEIFDEDSGNWTGDNAFQGCQIISKYTNDIIQGAGHDEIWSADVQFLIDAGMTLEEFKQLRNLNWMIQDDYLACFV
jgi:hypothetical protein